MKSFIIVAAVTSLLSFAFAQPHGHRHVHPRADVTDYITVTAPEIVVWVNDQGSTVSIETRTSAVGTTSSTSVPVPPLSLSDTPTFPTPSASISTPVQPSPIPSFFFASPPSSALSDGTANALPTPAPIESTSAIAPPPGAKEAPTSTPATSFADAPPHQIEPSSEPAHSAPPPSATQGSAHQAQGSGSGFGITWSPYTADSGCKSQDQANSEFAQLAGAGFSKVRIYGVDCNQVAMTVTGVSQYNMAIFAGLVSLDNLASNLNSMIAQVGSNWHMIDTVSIGNELVNNGLDPAVVVAALNTARPILNSAGYTGHIVTVDVFDQLINHPELCTASDYCAANCHAFFDNQITADQAGTYVSQASTNVAQKNPGKQVIITESGWPWSGLANGAAVPSSANHQTAITKLRDAFVGSPGSLFLFDSYDAMWKQPGPFGVEQYFGIYGH